MRKDTTLAAAGAEFLVLGMLLVREIESYKSHGNQKGYDIVSVNPENGKNARIQVKSNNFEEKSDFFLNSKEKECDFYVFVKTGAYRRVKKTPELIEEKDRKRPRLFIMDVETIQKYKSIDKSGHEKIKMPTETTKTPYEEFEDNWQQIKDFLAS